MKTVIRKTILVLMMSLGMLGYSQKDSIPPTTSLSETERLLDKYSEKVGAALNSLSESLKVPIERVYEILIKQQYVFAITHTIILILWLIACIYAIYKNMNSKDGEEWWGFPAMILLAWLVYFFMVLSTIVGCYFNPEYYVIMEIKDFIK
jgi:hypothetical protein